MATESTQVCVTFVAGADLSSWQYKPVKFTSGTDRTVEAADADNDPSIGILQNKPTSGQAATVCIYGMSKAHFGATLTAGAIVECQATSGEVIANAAGGFGIGWVIEGAADGEIGTILVQPSYVATA